MNPEFRSPSGRFCPQALLATALWAAWACVIPVGLAAANTNSAPSRGESDRYLLIVDTSAAMERNAENTPRIVGQLMASGMIGQARAGDTFGLWTYNEVLRTGDFPLQRWTIIRHG